MITAIFIDDEPLIRKQVTDIFSWIDPEIRLLATFPNAASAIDFLKAQNVDVVFTDIFLRTASGIDIARYIYDHNLSTKVVLVSAHKSFDHAKQGYKYNVYAYINKPFDIAELKELISQIKKELTPQVSAPVDTLPDNTALTLSHKIEKQAIRKGKNTIDTALNYIEDHYAHDISLSTISACLDLSPSYFSRLFKQTTGVTFSDYLINLRISKAAALLKESSATVDVIAHSVGYNHIPLFYSTFKKQTGLTPLEFRKYKGGKNDSVSFQEKP